QSLRLRHYIDCAGEEAGRLADRKLNLEEVAMRNWRIVLFVAGSLLVSRLLAPAVAPAQSDDPLMRLYGNNELFEQLSGAARSLLELKFGRKAGEAIPTPEIIPNAPAGPS